MSSKLPQQNYIACLLGGAIGDALGAPVEFMSINSIRERFGSLGVIGYVEFPDGSGEFTDDTQMTLFTAEGLLRYSHHDAGRGSDVDLNRKVYESYLRWLHTQGVSMYSGTVKLGMNMDEIENGWLLGQKSLFKRRAPGNTCLSALQSGQVGTIEEPINNSKGCGGIMRVAPVGLAFPGRNEFAFRIASEIAAITHGHPSGYLSAGFFASLISDLAVGIDLQVAINNALLILEKWNGCGETLQAVGNALKLYENNRALIIAQPEMIPGLIEELGAGWVGEEALAISLFCSLLYTGDFEKGVLAAVNHSGDCDSTASIAGNILGMLNGLDSIPGKWITNLRSNEIVNIIGADLHSEKKSP